MDSVLPWVLFNALVIGLLAVDLFVFHRTAHVVRLREAAAWSAVWVALALVFAAGVFFLGSSEKGVEFLTGYLIEKSLSVDNIFVFILLFSYFSVPAQYQHRVLFWGILGALVMRGLLILTGAVLLDRFHWTIYLFGAIILASGIKMLLQKHENANPERNPVLRVVRRLIPVSSEYHGQSFFHRMNGRLMLTPLAIVLLAVETTDVIFAIDSIPAIFAVSRDPFIVYTSNVFAILGLRALYFLMAGAISRFVYLKVGLSAILIWIGCKMIFSDLYHVPTAASLAVIAAVLTVTVGASLWRTAKLDRSAGLFEAGNIAPVPVPVEVDDDSRTSAYKGRTQEEV